MVVLDAFEFVLERDGFVEGERLADTGLVDKDGDPGKMFEGAMNDAGRLSIDEYKKMNRIGALYKVCAIVRLLQQKLIRHQVNCSQTPDVSIY